MHLLALDFILIPLTRAAILPIEESGYSLAQLSLAVFETTHQSPACLRWFDVPSGGEPSGHRQCKPMVAPACLSPLSVKIHWPQIHTSSCILNSLEEKNPFTTSLTASCHAHLMLCVFLDGRGRIITRQTRLGSFAQYLSVFSHHDIWSVKISNNHPVTPRAR